MTNNNSKEHFGFSVSDYTISFTDKNKVDVKYSLNKMISGAIIRTSKDKVFLILETNAILDNFVKSLYNNLSDIVYKIESQRFVYNIGEQGNNEKTEMYSDMSGLLKSIRMVGESDSFVKCVIVFELIKNGMED